MRTSIIGLTFIFLGPCVQEQGTKFIKPLDPVDGNYESKMELVDKFDIEVSEVGMTTIKLFVVKNWGDAGDYLKTEIKNDKYSVSFSNKNGWVRFDKNYSVSDNLKNANELKTDKLLLLTNRQTTLLIMFGWVYANNPGLCTIVDLKTGKIVFNTEKELVSVSADKTVLTFSDGDRKNFD